MNNLTNSITQTQQGMKIWQQERAVFELTEMICELLISQNVSRSELASRLGKTKGYVSQLLDGEANMTIHTASDVLFALGKKLIFRVEPVNTQMMSHVSNSIEWAEQWDYKIEYV